MAVFTVGVYDTASGVKEMKNPLYSDKLMEHFENPRNVGSFPEGEENVVSGMVGSPACGDTLKLELKLDPETEIIIDVRFKTFGCASAVASSSLLTEWVKGKTISEALEIKNKDIAKELDLPPLKVHCSLMAQDALEVAAENYQKMKAGEVPDDGLQTASSKCELPPEECMPLADGEVCRKISE